MKEKIFKLLELLFMAKQKGIDVFLNYSSHVEVIRICICLKGWYENYEYDKHFELYLDEKDAEKKADEAIKYFEKIIRLKEEEKNNE